MRRAAPGAMRLRHVAVLAAALALCAGAVRAQDGDATQRGNRLAYEAAMKCYVADGNAYFERHQVGDESKAALYDAKAKAAFDLAYRAGRALGLGEQEVRRDIQATQDVELPKLVRDPSYVRSSAATCKALHLM